MRIVTTADTIQTEFIVRCPRMRAWEALTTKAGWESWFSDTVESDFQAGSDLTMTFGASEVVSARVCERVEGFVFAFRWHPGDGCDIPGLPESEMTTVRFELEDHPEGTLIRFSERGFESIPADRRLRVLDMNDDGWSDELGEMASWLNDGIPHVTMSNSIKQIRTYKASVEQVWNAIATTRGLEGWFCKRAEGTMAPGEMVVLTFEHDGRTFSGPVKVVEYEPMSRIAWRWHPGQSNGCRWDDFLESEAVLVAFTLESSDGGAKLSIHETEYWRVPESRRAACLADNAQGWAIVVDWIGDYVEGKA